MALETASNTTTPSAQVVGNAFVEQYYHILLTSPELVYRFYQDSSVLSRPGADGAMTSVTTMQGINEKILSLNFRECKAEIKTADAQKSYNDGVTVLVTGCFIGKDDLRRKFAQLFFLAPQDNGYFVLNDVFRFVEDNELVDSHPVNSINNNLTVPSVPDVELSHVPDPSAPDPATSVVEEDENVAEDANNSLGHEEQLVHEREIIVEGQSHATGNDISIVVESTLSSAQEDAPKQSYASIVKDAKGISGPKVYVPTNATKLAPKKTENHLEKAVVPAPEAETLMASSNATPETVNAQEEVEGHSIYIRYLPVNWTVAQLEEKFKKFGPIKEGGVQIRYNKQQGYCFGFVEFHSLNSMNSAIQASPMTLGGHEAVVEMKRTTARVGSGRGGFPSGRAALQSDSFRVRGNNYGGGRGFGRNDRGRGEFPGRGRSSSGRGEGYQQGRGRGGGRRSSGVKPNANSSSGFSGY